MTDATPVDVPTSTEAATTAKAPRSANVLFVAGLMTLAVLTFFVNAWIDVHNNVWQAGRGCNPFGAPNSVRGLTTLVAAAGIVGIGVSGLWLGFHPANRNARRLLWSAIVLAWLAVGGIWVFGLDVLIDCALVE